MVSLEELRDMLDNVTEFRQSTNYFFEHHTCVDGESKKVQMDYKFRYDQKDEIIKFGFCPDCKICIYHNDYESSRF